MTWTVRYCARSGQKLEIVVEAKHEAFAGHQKCYNIHMRVNQLRTREGRKIHFAVMAIESGARLMGIPNREMHDRLKAQDLIHNRLLGRYDLLHTQSRAWVADDIVKTLENWEAGR